MRNKQAKIIHIEKSPANVWNYLKPTERPSKRTILLVGPEKPCSWAVRSRKREKPKPCKHCAFWNETSDRPGVLFEDAIKDIDEGRVELLVGGSMTDKEQIPSRELSEMLFKLANNDGVSTVLIETRPEYIHTEELRSLTEMLGMYRRLEVAIGVETMNDEIRDSMGKGFSKEDIRNAFKKIISAGAYPVAYLLVGHNVDPSRYGSSETEGQFVESDLYQSAKELYLWQKELAPDLELERPIRLAIETFYPHGVEMDEGNYINPKFVAGAMRKIAQDFRMPIFIATSSEGLCTHPLSSVKGHIDNFNATQDIRHLDEIIEGPRRRRRQLGFLK